VIRLLWVIFLVVAIAAAAQNSPAPLAFAHVNVVDTRAGGVQRDVSVLVVGGRIAGIGRNLKVPAQTIAVDAKNGYLIPGLWDMHVHTDFGDWLPGGREVILPLFVANGVTGVRDMGGDLKVLQQWRADSAAGKLIGPRMVISGPMLDGPQPRFPASISIRNATDALRAVDDLRSGGADFIKIQSLIPRDGYFAAADEAKKRNITFVGHVPDAVRASEAAEAGQKSIEHLTGVFEACSPLEAELMKGPKGPRRFVETYDDARATALTATFARKRTWQVPTLIWERGQWLIDESDFRNHPLAKYAPAYWKEHTWKMFTDDILKTMDTDPVAYRRRFVQKELDIVGKMHRAGVPFLAGTDTAAGVYVLPGFSLHEELQLFVRAGFTPLEALQTATLNPALFLGREADFGAVEKGKSADLVLLSANPLENIGNTRSIEAVVIRGQLLRRKDLDALLRQVQTAAASLSVRNDRRIGAQPNSGLRPRSTERTYGMVGSLRELPGAAVAPASSEHSPASPEP